MLTPLDPQTALIVIDLQWGPRPKQAAQPGDLHLQQQTWGACTGLKAQWRGRGVTGTALCGVATSVASTARQAYKLGFDVTRATDAMTDLSPETYHNSLTRVFPHLGETDTTAQMLSLLSQTRTVQTHTVQIHSAQIHSAQLHSAQTQSARP